MKTRFHTNKYIIISYKIKWASSPIWLSSIFFISSKNIGKIIGDNDTNITGFNIVLAIQILYIYFTIHISIGQYIKPRWKWIPSLHQTVSSLFSIAEVGHIPLCYSKQTKSTSSVEHYHLVILLNFWKGKDCLLPSSQSVYRIQKNTGLLTNFPAQLDLPFQYFPKSEKYSTC